MNNVSAMVEIFHKGGYVMYILLLLSLAVVAIAIDRYLFFKRSDSGRQFAREFYGLLHQKEYAQAFALARESHGTMAEVICEAADGYLEDSQGLASYLEIQSGIMLSQFNAKLYFLSVVVTMAPLLGLLGTITGMMSSFQALGDRWENPLGVTAGVAEAMITTVFGLLIAIATICFHTYFSQKVNTVMEEVEQMDNAFMENAGKMPGQGGQGA